MKLKSKEINIFSMSALDLFASALGAFILITVALFPFFPNTGDSPERVADIKNELEAAEESLERTQAALEQEQQKSQQLEEDLQQATNELEKASEAKLPPLDLIIALDTTRSMERQVAGLRQDIDELAEILVVLADDVGIGLIEFKDRCYPPTSVRSLPLQKVDNAGLNRLRSFTRTMEASSPNCNTTPPESFTEALIEAANMSWRPSTKKRAIVLISDNPAHADLRQRGIDVTREFTAREGARHTVSTVFVLTNAPRDPQARSYLQRVAETGNGKFVPDNEAASFTITILKALVD